MVVANKTRNRRSMRPRGCSPRDCGVGLGIAPDCKQRPNTYQVAIRNLQCRWVQGMDARQAPQHERGARQQDQRERQLASHETSADSSSSRRGSQHGHGGKAGILPQLAKGEFEVIHNARLPDAVNGIGHRLPVGRTVQAGVDDADAVRPRVVDALDHIRVVAIAGAVQAFAPIDSNTSTYKSSIRPPPTIRP